MTPNFTVLYILAKFEHLSLNCCLIQKQAGWHTKVKLTGSNGYLGKKIISYLCERRQGGRCCCVAINLITGVNKCHIFLS